MSRTFLGFALAQLKNSLVPISNKLDTLPSKTDIDSSIKIVRGKIARLEERVERIHAEVNDSDSAQYVRLLGLRTFGVSISCFHDKAVEDWVLQYVAEAQAISLPADAIERAHRIGKVNGGKVQVVVPFSSWKSRCLVYLNRKKGKFPIRVDLTQEHQTLYRGVRAVVIRNPEKLAFVDAILVK